MILKGATYGRSRPIAVAVLLTLLAAVRAGAATDSFVNFESGQVRPLALSPDGGLLFAVNTPDNRLAVFAVTATGLDHVSDVPVGLEPVAVAVRATGTGLLEAWVVNHLSDSVSIVRVDPDDPAQAVVRGTLLVGDEPRDIVFGGSNHGRAFVTTARRGQNLPAGIDPALTTEGTPRALVWVFDASDPFADTPYDADAAASPLGGEPLNVLELFGDSPRALAVSPDGSLVHAAIFLSGNQTTTVNPFNVDQYGGAPPPPADSPYYPNLAPTTSLIVRFDPASGQWRDELARDWSSTLRLSLPDQDVFTIDADATPPTLLPARTVSGVGTVLYGMAVRPDTGGIFVANTEAHNEIRFEPLIDATHGVQGRFVDNRVTIIETTGPPTFPLPVGLNPHADRTVPTGPASEIAQSLALPTALTFSADGHRLYVTGFGSQAVGIFDADALEAGVVDRTLVAVGGGPSGVVLDDARQRLYVLNRFDQTISLVEQADDPNAAHVGATIPLFDPSPPEVKDGRSFNFDARRSGHGDVACGSCHVYGDFDGLGWDLGNPYGQILPNPNLPTAPPWSPMKGPMTTQSLRGMAGAGPLHWRGDRTAASHGGSQFDVDGAFKEFNPAFVGLLGNAQQLTPAEMQTYTDWALTIRYPPNPNAQLDGTLTTQQAQGFAFFMDRGCNICHALPLGTSGASVSIGGGEGRKIPHLRNVYTKVGMFGQQPEGLFQALPFLGDQMRGFGFFHDGANAVTELAIVLLGTPAEMLALPDVNAYVMAFPTGLAPVVGQQVSANPASVADPVTLARRDLLIARANAGDCDLVVHGMISGRIGGARYLGGGVLESDRVLAGLTTVTDLWNGGGAAGAEQLWTCVPPGSGARIGIDRDEDGFRDGDEVDAGTDPADPVSHPGAVLRSIATSRLKMKDLPRRTFRFVSTGDAVVAPAAGGSGDPTTIGATLRIFNGAGSGEQVTIPLPADGWRARRNGFVYHLHTQGIDSVRIRAGRLSIRGGASAFGYTLDEPTQGRIVVRLSIGVVDYCADAAPTAATDVDSIGRFEVHHAPSSASCPAPPGP